MKRRIFCAGTAAFLAGCGGRAAAESFAILDGADEPLRGAFNRARNAVRVVMLVSPT
jgi:hypothetical protein